MCHTYEAGRKNQWNAGLRICRINSIHRVLFFFSYGMDSDYVPLCKYVRIDRRTIVFALFFVQHRNKIETMLWYSNCIQFFLNNFLASTHIGKHFKNNCSIQPCTNSDFNAHPNYQFGAHGRSGACVHSNHRKLINHYYWFDWKGSSRSNWY